MYPLLFATASRITSDLGYLGMALRTTANLACLKHTVPYVQSLTHHSQLGNRLEGHAYGHGHGAGVGVR